MAFPQGAIPGIDVSHLQGVVDWTSVVAGGDVFAFAKATEGITFNDPYFHDNWQGMKQAGLLRGAYHYYRANDDPAAQANTFLTALGNANGSATLAPGDLPAALDLEVTLGVDPATILQGVATWLTTVEAATGQTPFIYTYPSFWQGLGNPLTLSQYPLWIARYGVSSPGSLGGWSDWTIWQFDPNHTISGVAGPVDADGYQGTLASLQALAGIVAAAPPDPGQANT